MHSFIGIYVVGGNNYLIESVKFKLYFFLNRHEHRINNSNGNNPFFWSERHENVSAHVYVVLYENVFSRAFFHKYSYVFNAFTISNS